MLDEFNVPHNQEGTLWTVFEIENGQLRTINTLTNQSNPSNVRSIDEVPHEDFDLFENLPEKIAS